MGVAICIPMLVESKKMACACINHFDGVWELLRLFNVYKILQVKIHCEDLGEIMSETQCKSYENV